MADYVQISAQISAEMRDRLDRYARETGLKKSRIVEEAIGEHLDAVNAIPPEYIIPTRITVDEETWERLNERIDNPGEASPELRELLAPYRDEFRKILGLDD